MNKKKTYIYGGTFDPPHQGHLEVVKTLLKEDQQIVIAPTEQNPFKKEKATPLAIRIELLEAALDSLNLKHTRNIKERTAKEILISDFSYSYVCDFIDWWRSFDDSELYWVVASDIEDQVESWKRWNELDVKKFVVPITIDISATDIRTGIARSIPAVSELIKKYQLY